MKFKMVENFNEFINEEDRQIFEYYLQHKDSILMEMANVLGNSVKVYDRLPFSFFFSTRSAVHNTHGIRAKLIWNPSKAPSSVDGILQLHGEYEYEVLSHKYKPTSKELNIARDFFKKYKVLFAAVWEEVVDQSYVQHYLSGFINLKELLSRFEIKSEKKYYHLNHCNSIEEAEACVRKYKIFNMNE